MRAELAAAVAAVQPETSSEMLAVLNGVRWEIAKNSSAATLLAAGKGGPGEVRVMVHLEPWAAPVTVGAALEPSLGWPSPRASEQVTLQPGETKSLICKVEVPAGADTHWIPVRLKAGWAGVTLSAVTRLEVVGVREEKLSSRKMQTERKTQYEK